MFNDMAFELDYPAKNMYSDKILLTALKWTDKDKLIAGIRSMFEGKTI